MYYRMIHEPKEGEEVQYLAVYALCWPWDRGIEPTDAFVQVDDPLLKAAPLLLEACKGLLASIESMIVDDNVQIYSGDKVRIAKAQAAIAAASPDSYQAEPEEHNG